MEKKNNYLYIDSSKNTGENTYQSTFMVSETPKIDYLISEAQYSEALSLLEKTFNKDNDKYFQYKAIIYERKEDYEKAAEALTNISNQTPDIKILKAETLYKWAKITFFPKLEYEKALKLINDALDTLPDSEDPSEYYFLKAEILEALNELVEARKAYLIAYKEFDKLKEFEKQVEYLKNTQDTLVNISGGYYYDFTPESGQTVNLVKEPENEHDSDAIAVYLDNEKIGYVANSEYTLMDKVKSATKLKNMISDDAQAEILFVYLDEYVIAKVFL